MKLFNPDNSTFDSLDVKVENHANEVRTTFHFLRDIGIPLDERRVPGTSYSRQIGLWEKTCFELFIKNSSNSDYFEVNLSPDLNHWNAFYFEKYRTPLTQTDQITLKHVDVTQDSFAFTLNISAGDYEFHPKMVLFLDQNSPIYLSDLKHPKTGPDFHIFSIT